MKTAITIAGAEAGESAFVVWRGFEDSIRKAAEYGYDGVELALKSSEEIDRHQLRTWLKETSLEVSCITTGQIFADLGLYFTHENADLRNRTADAFFALIDLAEEFGGLVNVGRARGFVAPRQRRKQAEDLFVEMMQRLCDYAAPKGVQILIEPVNRYEINFVNTLDEGADILRKVARPNCGLHADVFHMNIEEDRISGSLIRNRDWVRYVHLADSNRLAPGMGHLDFREVLDALQQIKYDGWVSVEILPGSDPDRMALQAIEYLKRLMVQTCPAEKGELI